jgi:hypothetical protein
MKPARPNHGFTLAVFAVAAALAIAVVVALTNQDEPAAQPTATPGIVATAKELALVPPVSDEVQRTITREIGVLLTELYERAFVPEAATRTPAPTGEVSASSRIDSLFTRKAAEALRKDPDVWERAADFAIGRGRVTFGGLATLEGSKPVQALLEVEFEATGTPEQRVSPVVRVRQKGTVLLVYSSDRWFVDGFDLEFASAPVTPSPSPTS